MYLDLRPDDGLHCLAMRHHVAMPDPVDRGGIDIDPLSELWPRYLVGGQVILQRHFAKFAYYAWFKNT